MRAFFKEFCDNSSVPGVRYVSERRRHWTERIWWIFAIVASFYLCSSSINQIWVQWNESPVTLTLAEKEQPISAIPFPTVTICSHLKYTKAKLLNGDQEVLLHAESNETSNEEFNEESNEASDEASDEESDISAIESSRLDAHNLMCGYHDRYGNKFINSSVYETIVDIAPAFESTISGCSWKRRILLSCSQNFSRIWTGEGLCYAFNALNAHEMYTQSMNPEMMIPQSNPNITHWSLDYGYDDGMHSNEYPIRVFSSKSVKLSSYLTVFTKDVGLVCDSDDGFSVRITGPGDTAKESDVLTIGLQQIVKIFIKPKLITTSENLRNYNPNRRQCFFNSERQLRFFKIYTENNCEVECLANFTEVECGCVKFSMPREKSTRICGTGSVKCYRDAAWELFGTEIIEGMENKVARSFREKCNCLPACTTISYEVEKDKKDDDFPLPGGHQSQLTISFRDAKVVTLHRSALYTYTDFFAVCGGLLGLFLGVSVLSIIELAYYFTLRLFWTIRQSKSENEVVPFQRKPNNSIFIDIPND